MRATYNFDLDEVRTAAKVSYTVSDLMRLLGASPTNSPYRKALKRFLDKHGIIMLGPKPTISRRRSTSEYLVLDGPSISSSNLKKKLINEGILPETCSICGLGPLWLGCSLSLHLDHVNGNNRDNRIENLRILCPNCHSQTDTYCGRGNKGRKLPSRFLQRIDRETLVKEANDSSINQVAKKYGVAWGTVNAIVKDDYTAYDKVTGVNKRRFKIDWPDLNELDRMLSEGSYESVAKELGVSSNAIRKHIKARRP